MLIDIGCEYYFIVDKDFIIELWFPRVKIAPKPIISLIKENIKEPGVVSRCGAARHGSGIHTSNDRKLWRAFH